MSDAGRSITVSAGEQNCFGFGGGHLLLFVCLWGWFLLWFVWFCLIFFQWYEDLSPYLHHQHGTALLKSDRLSSRGEKEKKPPKFKITKKKTKKTTKTYLKQTTKPHHNNHQKKPRALLFCLEISFPLFIPWELIKTALNFEISPYFWCQQLSNVSKSCSGKI